MLNIDFATVCQYEEKRGSDGGEDDNIEVGFKAKPSRYFMF